VTTATKIPIAPVPAIDALLQRLRDIKRTMKDLEEQRIGKNGDGVEIELANIMKEWQISTASVEVDGVKITGTLMESSTMTIDEERLKRALGAQKWQNITSRVLDRAKLEDAIAKGLIDATTVAQCSVEQPRRPWIKITEKVTNSLRGRRR
jgi:hypothetical protein